MNIIIIGSGLGGLSCGVILAKNGHHVTVLEQGMQIGGCLQTFVRHGVKFETGMHFIGSAAEGQILDLLMRYLELKEDVKLAPMDKDGYDVVSLSGERYKFPVGREACIRQLAEYFPGQRQNLEHYFDLVEEVAKASSLMSMCEHDINDAVSVEYQMRSMDEVIESVISDPQLQMVLAGNQPLYAAQKGKTPFSLHAFIRDFYNKSAYRIVGGSDCISESLQKTIERYDGEVRTHSKVVSINCDETKAVSVTLANGTEIPADYVISSAHPQQTLKWIDSKLIRPAFRKRVMDVPNTVSGFTLYVEFKDNTVPFMNYNFYGYPCGTPWDCEHYDETSWPKSYLYMHMCHEDNPRYAKSAEVLAYMWMDDLRQWENTSVGRRGEDYKAFKERMAQRLIDAVEKEFPGFRNSIKRYYTSTPLTYRDYTGTTDGSFYGVAKDIALGSSGRISHKTRIPNLLFTGQNVNSHGVLGVLVGTVVTCAELLGANTIIEQITKNHQSK